MSKRKFPHKEILEVERSIDGKKYFAIFNLVEEVTRKQFIEYQRGIIKHKQEDINAREGVLKWMEAIE